MKKLIITLITTSLLLTSCSEEKVESVKKYYSTGTVQSGSILDSDSYIGYTDSFENATLSAKAPGKIVSISKNVGDNVKSGEIIATLDSSEAKTGFNSSNDIISSLGNLKISTSQMFDSQIQVLEEKINGAKLQADISSIGSSGTKKVSSETQNTISSQLQTIESQIDTANTGLETAKLQKENSVNILNNKENDIYNNSKNAITNADILGNNINDFIDNLFGITDANKYKNDSFETYISAKDSSIKTKLENDFRSIQAKYNNIKNLPQDNNENIKIALEKYNDLFTQDYRNLLKTAYKAMENSISSSSFSENSINTYKSQINTLQSQNEQVILSVSGNYFLGIKGSLDSINAFSKEKKSTLDMLEKQIETANKQIETLKQTKNQITSAGNTQITDINTKAEISDKQKELSNNAVAELLATIESLKAQKDAKLRELDTQISQVNSGKNDSLVMIQNGKVISLVDGVVTKKISEIGDVIGAGMPIMTISGVNKIKIEVQVTEDVLQKVGVGNKVQVEIEGVPEQKTGIISKILPTRDQITKKATIEVTLDNPKKDIKLGSYSKVYFDLKSDNNGILIPNKAIISKYNIPQVFVLENKTANLKTIKILKQNDNFSQIEGLKVGDIIIIDGKENVYDGEGL